MVNPANAQAIVDDQGPGVQFDGQWQRQGSSLEFASTTSISQTQGATAKFTFDGLSFSLPLGTLLMTSRHFDYSVRNSYNSRREHGLCNRWKKCGKFQGFRKPSRSCYSTGWRRGCSPSRDMEVSDALSRQSYARHHAGADE